MLGWRLGGCVIDRRAADRHHIGLAARVVDRHRVLARDRGRRLESVAVVGAVVTSGAEHRLPLRGGLFEQQVLRLLETGLAELDGLLAQPPAGAHDLVGVGVDDRRVLVDRVVVGAVGARARSFVDVDGRPRRERGDVLDVEVRLAAARPGRLAAVDRDHVQPLEHARGRGSAEVARVERLDVRAQERLELVDGDVLARTEVAAAVEPEGAVRVGDLIVGQPTELVGRRGGARAGPR